MIPLCSKCEMETTQEYISRSADNVEECKQICMKKANCVGIDFGINKRKGQCWLNYGTIKKTVSHNDFNSWKKNPACGMIYMIIIANYKCRFVPLLT